VNKSNKRLVRWLAPFAFLCAVGVAQSDVVAIGPIEKVQGRAGSITVLGQTFAKLPAAAKNEKEIQVGRYVAVVGERVNGLLVAETMIFLDEPYVAGSSAVMIRGPVDRYIAETGVVQTGNLKILLSQGFSSGSLNYVPGDVIEIVGTQALPNSPVWATEIRDSSESSISDSVRTLSIQGTGKQSIQGTGVQSIQGTGLLSIQGTGKQSIQGTGVQSIQGTGKQSIQGTGVQSIQGTGALSIQGTGKQAIQGTGVQSIQGTGTLSIQGTGKRSIQGTGVL
jgi:hypothetical protein